MSVKNKLIVAGAWREINRLMKESSDAKPEDGAGYLMRICDEISVIAFEAARACEAIIRERDNAPEVEL